MLVHLMMNTKWLPSIALSLQTAENFLKASTGNMFALCVLKHDMFASSIYYCID